MNIKNPKFEISATNPKQYPQNVLPEIVLVGKSYVGKSSFINTLVNRKNLARTSSQPGKTILINFYNIDQQFYLVDLPGYGFSKMSKTQQAQVGQFIEEYLVKSNSIKLVLFLVDIRHDPTANDQVMYQYCVQNNLPFIVICNKADKIAPTKVQARVDEIQMKLNPLKDLAFYPFSSERKIYTDTILQVMENKLLS